MKAVNYLILGVVAAVLLFVLGSGAVIVDMLGWTAIARTVTSTNLAEAETEAARAKASAFEAQAKVIRAEGEAEIMEAAARAVDNNTRLVAWYAVRTDVRVVVAFVIMSPFLIAGGIVIGTKLSQSYDKRQEAIYERAERNGTLHRVDYA